MHPGHLKNYWKRVRHKRKSLFGILAEWDYMSEAKISSRPRKLWGYIQQRYK